MEIDKEKLKKSEKNKNLVLFDFDGTLSRGDTNAAFYKYCFKHSLRPWFHIHRVMFAMLYRFVAKFFKRDRFTVTKSDITWREISKSWMTLSLIKRLLPGFLDEFRTHRFGWAAQQVRKEHAGGNTVILTTAGPDFLIFPLVCDMDFDYIITTETRKRRRYKIKFFNYRANKVAALQPFLDAGYTVLRAYSDSKNDMPMMNLAKTQIWINSHDGTLKRMETWKR
ncbi:MAG: haloacid dehalogenase-like hydrolase [Rickettsiales bacterium]|nr:haloacid dehalogenase-like hydrolase [Rickettsiales bacterium]